MVLGYIVLSITLYLDPAGARRFRRPQAEEGLRGGEGTADGETVGSNRSIENRLYNFDKRISSKSSN